VAVTVARDVLSLLNGLPAEPLRAIADLTPGLSILNIQIIGYK